jgi:ferredoxin
MALAEYLNFEVVDDRGWDLDDEDLFEKAAEADLDETDYGFFEVDEGEYVLNAAEAAGHDWPFSCRNGICSNCAAILVEGSVEMDGNQALNEEEVDEKNVRLTCISRPTSDHLRLVYNAKLLEYLQDRVMY